MSIYSIADYGGMIADQVRIDAFARALRRAVTPESVVLDLGTGTGMLALLAAQAGASRVFAVDESDAIQIARETARANGLEDRVEFVFGDSRDLELPERANLLVCDIHGTLPWALGSVRTLVDARNRLLVPGATTIPRRDTLRVAVVEAEEVYGHRMEVWRRKPHGLDIEVGRRFAVNKWRRERLTPAQVLSEVGHGATLDYASTEDANMVSRLELEVARPGTGHGLAAWFDCRLDDEVAFSSGPDNPESIYQQGLFLWEEPVELRRGERVQAELRADFVNGRYLWSWASTVHGKDGSTRAEFRHSAFYDFFPSEEHRRKRAADYEPELTSRGRALGEAIRAMSRGQALGEIAAELAERFPDRFSSPSEALAFVGELSLHYSR